MRENILMTGIIFKVKLNVTPVQYMKAFRRRPDTLSLLKSDVFCTKTQDQAKTFQRRITAACEIRSRIETLVKYQR